jgi:three-Cys-motif partner protein
MDILAHVSSMDLDRNIEQQSADTELDEFDEFAPAWRENVPVDLPQTERRATVIRYWAWRVGMELGLDAASDDMHPIKNSKNRVLYWLVLLARHELAKKFWNATVKGRPQSTREMW